MISKNQKKVLFVITKSNWGGAQRYVYDIATILDPVAFQPRVACGGDGVLIEKLRDAGIHVIPIPALVRDISAMSELRALVQMYRIIRAEQPEVLHINSSKAGLYGALLGRFARVPRIIFTAHGWAFNEDRPWWQRVIFKTLHWLTVLLSHETIAVSHTTKEQLNWPFAAKKISVVPLGRTITSLKSRDDARQLIEMHATGTERGLIDFHDDYWLGTIAELHPVKQLNIAIDAVAALVHKHPKLRYIVIGEGGERATLAAQIAVNGLEEHVFLVGAFEEAARLLPAFDLFVLPSRSEASGYVLLEAGIAGVPVVASNVGGIPELVIDQKNGLLVPAGDTDALIAALNTSISAPETTAARAATLQESATSRSLIQMVETTAAHYTTPTPLQ